MSLARPQTLFQARKTGHQARLHVNAYDDLTRTSGAFYEMKCAIENAEEFVCITSWNNFLTKDLGMSTRGKEVLLIDLLADAAVRGVKIFILMWDRPSESTLIGDSGIEDNRIVFASLGNQNIFYKKAMRNGGPIANNCYSHHSKILITEQFGFVGGLDFLPTVIDSYEHADIGHKMWHDAVCQIKGPVIKDIFDMFFARWFSQPASKMLYNSDDMALGFLHSIQTAFLKSKKYKEEKAFDADQSVQFLVSLSSYDYRLPEKSWPLETLATAEIHKTLITTIDHAKKYIFMANQYFVGHYNNHADSSNALSYALVKRILRAHKEGEPFHVYFALTAFPGEDINASAPFAILRKEWKTLNFIFERLNKRTQGHAEDYITVIELGKQSEDKYHQVYVHSKFLFTPQTILMGSANFNERSLAGDRDSESMLKLEGYTKEINDFRDKLIKEYFGLETYQILKEKNLLNSLEDKVAVSILNKNIEARLNTIPSKIIFAQNTTTGPLLKIFSKEKTSSSQEKNIKKTEDNKVTIESKSTSEQGILNKLRFFAASAETGCALPWGLIPKQQLLAGEKPGRIPDSTPQGLRLISLMGGDFIFR